MQKYLFIYGGQMLIALPKSDGEKEGRLQFIRGRGVAEVFELDIIVISIKMGVSKITSYH